ncbi:MAG TPA: long-chain-fatty-acid--CoA ligase [Steroidobacteraceae bacterium]
MEIALSPMEFARRARRLYSDREAVVDGGHRWTYADFFDRCDRWSAALQAMGIGQGDRVAYIAPNTHAHLEAYYAVPQIGAVLVPINYRLTGGDFAYLIGHCGARVVCVDSDYCDALDDVRSELGGVEKFVALDNGRDRPGWIDYESALTQAPPIFTPADIAEGDLLTINYTSGTTARPKGVMITHRNAYMNSVGTLIHHHMTCADRYVWTLPMFHANGWTFVWTVTAVGGTHLCVRRVDPVGIFETLRDEGGTMLCAAPTVLIGIANASKSLRQRVPRGVRVLTAGAAPAAATIERLETEFGWEVTQVYGLTETAPFIAMCEPRPEHVLLSARERARTKIRQGVELITSGEVRVVDPSGAEVPTDATTTGEIVARGNVVMQGYYNDPEATCRSIRNGWFHSGDAAVVHPDGYIEIRDRLKDVIISGGENISSIEVEGVLLQHPALQEVAIVGTPDETWGEVPCAFVVLQPGCSATESELREFARERMAHFKCPKSFRFVAELPKTATGKIQKHLLRGNAAGTARE